MATIFEYEPISSPIHRLNPITKTVLFFSIIFLSGFYLDPRYKLPLLVVSIILCKIANFPFQKYQGLLKVAVIAVLFASFFRGIFMVDPGYFKSFSADFVSTQLLEITPDTFPIFGRTAITFGTLLWMSAPPLTTATMVLAMACFMHTTSQSEFIQVLTTLRLPNPIVFAIMVALRFIPTMIRQMETIQIAQTLRGWQVKTKNPIKVIKGYLPLMAPITRYVVDSVDQMTISSKNRAFGVNRPTGLRDVTFQMQDYVINIAALTIFTTGLFLLFAYNMGTL